MGQEQISRTATRCARKTAPPIANGAKTCKAHQSDVREEQYVQGNILCGVTSPGKVSSSYH